MNYEELVKKVCPNAIFWRLSSNSLIGAIFESSDGRTKLTEYTIESKAWKSAYERLTTNL